METPIEQTSSFYLSDWHGSLGEFIWLHVLKLLESDNTIGDGLFQWLACAKVLSFSEEILMISVNTKFRRDVISRRCVPKIRAILQTHFLIDPEVVVITIEQ